MVVIRDEGRPGGLVETDNDEGGHAENRKDVQWITEERTRLGKTVTAVESEKIVGDWKERDG